MYECVCDVCVVRPPFVLVALSHDPTLDKRENTYNTSVLHPRRSRDLAQHEGRSLHGCYGFVAVRLAAVQRLQAQVKKDRSRRFRDPMEQISKTCQGVSLRKYNLGFESQEEDAKRFTIFKANMNRAAELTAKSKSGAKFGASKFAHIR